MSPNNFSQLANGYEYSEYDFSQYLQAAILSSIFVIHLKTFLNCNDSGIRIFASGLTYAAIRMMFFLSPPILFVPD